jgi:hypothetical protein
LLTEEGRRRFLREARAGAPMDHPGIIPVYETGEVGPICYIASAYADGPSLAEWLQRRREPVPPGTAAVWVASLAEAVEYAHQRKVLHRDIKPGNVLLVARPREEGEGPAEHAADLGLVPRLTDFGLAQLLGPAGQEGPPEAATPDTETADSAALRTRTGARPGTVPYMAPEQARGEAVGAATDVYALGVILYELLTGQRPFRGLNNQDTLRRVCEQEPVAPTVLRSGLPHELEAICLRCLAKQPQQRFASAGALAGQLRNWLRQSAGSPPRPPWLRRWSARFLVGGAVAVSVGLAVWSLTRERLPENGGRAEPAAPAEDEGQQSQRAFLRQLEEGQPATWIGPTGPPPVLRWALGGGTPKERPDRAFEVDAVLGLLEIARGAKLGHFRLEAEVQHVRDLGNGQVGLYIGHRVWEEEHCFCALVFTDARLTDFVQEENRWASACRLSLARLRAQLGREASFSLGTGMFFAPQPVRLGRKGPWRRLGVDVTAKGITTRWERQTETIPWGQYVGAVKFMKRGPPSRAGKPPLVPPWPNLSTEYEPESGVGLFVSQSRAAFRNVVLTRLP